MKHVVIDTNVLISLVTDRNKAQQEQALGVKVYE
jgi:predicted nucleic acid-binding protein